MLVDLALACHALALDTPTLSPASQPLETAAEATINTGWLHRQQPPAGSYFAANYVNSLVHTHMTLSFQYTCIYTPRRSHCPANHATLLLPKTLASQHTPRRSHCPTNHATPLLPKRLASQHSAGEKYFAANYATSPLKKSLTSQLTCERT